MTRVCLVGDEDVNLRYELLSRETSREALATYDLREPFANTVGVGTVSLGAAVAMLNDLDWYLARFVDEALVLEPSVSGDEWLSRDLATAVRDDELGPGETGRFLKVYGVEHPEEPERDGGSDTDEEAGTESDRPPRLVEPMLLARTGGTLPEYDLRDVDGTLVVRVTEAEFEG
jgi:hypothetical protein